MFKLILLILLNLLGFGINQGPARLDRKLTLREKIERWIHIHQYELLLILIFAMMITFVLAVIILVPPMDMWNNHFNEVI